jgi:hypothetical protein
MPSMRRVRAFLLAFAAFFALSATFALTDPLGAPIDEPGHMAWAAAVSDGQFTPHRYDQEVFWGHDLYLVSSRVRVPEEIAALDTAIDCFAQRPNIPAKCYMPLNDSTRTVTYHTVMGTYNPLYYLFVGWPAHVLPGLDGLYAMRLLSALLCSLLLACAAVLALRVGRLAFCGVLVGATPTVLFLAGSVNPNGPEAAGGLLAFTALSALALDPEPALVRSRFALFALGAAAVTVVRPAGLEWFAVLVAMAVLLLGARPLLALVRDRRCLPTLGGLLLALLYAAVWDLTRGGLNSIPVAGGDGYTIKDSLADSVRQMPGTFAGMIGGLGWNDTSAPFGTEAAWLGLLGFLLLGGLLLASRRHLLVLGTWLAFIVLMPVVANAITAKGLLNLWEGRYGLWFAVGLPVYAAMLIGTRISELPPLAARAERRLTSVVYAAVVFGQLAAYWVVVRRYGVGLDSAVLPHRFKWDPPVGWQTGCALLTLGLVFTGVLLLAFGDARKAHTAPPLPGSGSAAEPEPGPAAQPEPQPQPAQPLPTFSTETATAM